MLTLISKEILDHVKSLRFTLSWIILMVLVITAALLLSTEVGERIEGHELRNRSIENYVSNYAHMNRISYVLSTVRPIESTEILFRGIDDPHEQNSYFYDLFKVLITRVDLLYIVSIFLSLLAMILAYDSICGERENGTLKLLHTTQVSRFAIVVAKWIGIVCVVCLPFLVLMIVALLLGTTISGLSLTSSLLLDSLTIVLASVLYSGVFAALGIFISATARHSGTSILISLLAWILLVLVIPNVSPILASQIKPIPSVNKVEREARMLTDVIRDRRVDEERDKLVVRFLAERGLTGRVQNPGNEEQLAAAGLSSEEVQQIRNEYQEQFMAVIRQVNVEQQAQAKKLRDDLELKIADQREMTKLISLISPTTAFTYFSTDVASVGIRAEEHYYEEAEEYSEAFSNFLKERRAREEEKLGRQLGWEEFVDLSGRPLFQHRPEAFADRLSSVMIYLDILIIMLALSLILANVAYRRYDIR